jgi:hypothetical protein
MLSAYSSYTYHADQRRRERGFTQDEIDFILLHARRERRTGVIFCQMRDKDMPSLAGNNRYQRLRGVTVILCGCEQFVLTVYKNPEAFKKDRRKSKYNAYTGESCCPNCKQSTLLL